MILLTERQAVIRGEIWTVLEVRGQSFDCRDTCKDAGMRFGYPKDLYESSRAARRVPDNLQVPPEALDEDWGRYEKRWQMAFRGSVEQNRRKIDEVERVFGRSLEAAVPAGGVPSPADVANSDGELPF